MGAHRTPNELKPEIVRGTLHIIATGGMENFSFPKLTAETGISAPTVYEHYKNKEELLTTCFLDIDREIADCITKAINGLPPETRSGEDTEARCRLIFHVHWNHLISHAEKTVFLWSFLNSNYYTHKMQEQHGKHYGMLRDLITAAEEKTCRETQCDINLLAAHMVNATAGYASKTLRGYYKNDRATEETVYHMVFQPVYATLGIVTEPAAENTKTNENSNQVKG